LGRLVPIQEKNAMCSHRIDLGSTDEIDDEVLGWVRKAYDKAA